MVASPTMSETLQLAEVAEYEHLIVTGDPTDADQEDDLIETGAIVAGVFHSVAISIRRLPVALRWVHIMQGISDCAAPGSCTAKSSAGANLRPDRWQDVGREVADHQFRRQQHDPLAQRSVVVRKAGLLGHSGRILRMRVATARNSAILKMTALMRVGIPARSLWLVVLRNNGRGVLHAVLAVTTSSGTFILDNARANVAMDSDLPYQPLYSLSDNRAWIQAPRSPTSPPPLPTSGFPTIVPGEGFAAPGYRLPRRPPPSTARVAPVMWRPASDANSRKAPSRSDGCP